MCAGFGSHPTAQTAPGLSLDKSDFGFFSLVKLAKVAILTTPSTIDDFTLIPLDQNTCQILAKLRRQGKSLVRRASLSGYL